MNPSALRMVAILLHLATLTACAHTAQTAAPQATPMSPIRVGGDRDAHGCLPSGGYVWCAQERACRRPWALAKERGFDLNDDGFARHCGKP
jgi:hypothetical protein